MEIEISLPTEVVQSLNDECYILSVTFELLDMCIHIRVPTEVKELGGAVGWGCKETRQEYGWCEGGRRNRSRQGLSWVKNVKAGSRKEHGEG